MKPKPQAKPLRPAAPSPTTISHVLAHLARQGLRLVPHGHHHEGPLHPDFVTSDKTGKRHAISVDGEHIGGPY